MGRCAQCSANISGDEVQFDHIIPFSKGGTSAESNIRVVCELCNKKKANRVEAEMLVIHAGEQLAEHFKISFVELYLDAIAFAHAYRLENGSFPNASDYASEYHFGEVTSFETAIANSANELDEFFASQKPEEMTRTQFEALKKRWGFLDGNLYAIEDMTVEFNERVETLIVLERYLLARLGWYVDESIATQREWQKL